MKIAAAVILYNPDPSVSTNIASYSGFVEKVFIYDNSETEIGFTHSYLDNPKFVVNADGSNEGIAKRLNHACFSAIDYGFDWLLTMDQDSFFSHNQLKKYLKCLTTFEKSDQTAMLGVNHAFQIESDDCSLKEVNRLITSGSFVNLQLFKNIGAFNEELFIDQVDHEYCYRSIMKGYKILKAESVYLQHSLGTVKQGRSFKNLELTDRSLHSPVRLYYMLRNALYVRKRYKNNFPAEIEHMMSDLRTRVKNNLLYGSDRKRTIRMLLEAYKDFKKGKTGKIN